MTDCSLSFIESICVTDNTPQLLNSHQQRIDETARNFGFKPLTIKNIDINTPCILKDKKVKIKITYSKNSYKVDFGEYRQRKIESLKLIDIQNFDYKYKFANRDFFAKHTNALDNKEDVLFCKHGYITDTSFSNVVFVRNNIFYTPTTFLLNGVMRRHLLSTGRIKEIDIRADNILDYDSILLINALNNLDEACTIDCRMIRR